MSAAITSKNLWDSRLFLDFAKHNLLAINPFTEASFGF
jgi:hypothetical protein